MLKQLLVASTIAGALMAPVAASAAEKTYKVQVFNNSATVIRVRVSGGLNGSPPMSPMFPVGQSTTITLKRDANDMSGYLIQVESLANALTPQTTFFPECSVTVPYAMDRTVYVTGVLYQLKCT